MFGIDFCDVKMKSRYQLKFSKRHPHYMQLQQRLSNQLTEKISKSQKDVVYFQPEDNHETWNKSSQSEKVFKNYTGSNTSWNYFFFNFQGGWNFGEKRWGKHSYLATSREDIREAHTVLAYSFTDLPCSLHVYTSIHQECLNAKWFTVVSFNFGSFSQTEIISHAQ